MEWMLVEMMDVRMVAWWVVKLDERKVFLMGVTWVVNSVILMALKMGLKKVERMGLKKADVKD